MSQPALRHVTILALVAAMSVMLLSACTGTADPTTSTAPGSEATSTSQNLPASTEPPSVAESTDPPVPSETSSLTVYVSNQSFDDPTVDVTVSIDGVDMIGDVFEVEGQHTWIEFPLEVTSGEHVLVATSSTGAESEKEFTSDPGVPLYVVVSYWGADENKRGVPYLDVEVSETRPMFL